MARIALTTIETTFFVLCKCLDCLEHRSRGVDSAVYGIPVAMQVSAELPGDSLHTKYPPHSIPEVGAIVKLFLNRQVVEEQFHLFAPTGKVVHILIELVEKPSGQTSMLPELSRVGLNTWVASGERCLKK